jgi:hypothetical protein
MQLVLKALDVKPQVQVNSQLLPVGFVWADKCQVSFRMKFQGHGDSFTSESGLVKIDLVCFLTCPENMAVP